MNPSQAEQIKALDHRLVHAEEPAEKARIYLQAAEIYSESSNLDEACFFMTQAFVIAAHNGEKVIEKKARQFLDRFDRI